VGRLRGYGEHQAAGGGRAGSLRQGVDLRNSLGQTIAVGQDGALPEGAVPAAVLLQVSTEQARSLVGAVESHATLYLWLVGREHS
jgi:hypothetical protein